MTSSISKNTIERIAKDIKCIRKNPLTDNGIYYKHSDEELLIGYALIVGPKDSFYSGGFYLFKFDFPYDYPYSPPKVTFLTNDGYVRFHPNLYKNGKVCLSILNTWKGEGWTSCQSISSILLTITSILDYEPLCKEPGLEKSHIDFHNYNKIVEFKNIELAVIQVIKKKFYHDIINLFWEEILNNFYKNYNSYLKTIKNNIEKLENTDNIIYKTQVYCLQINCNYKKLLENLEKIYNKYNLKN